MISRARIGILGGTLDPIHLGHIEAAAAAHRALALERVVFVPSRVPPHRQLQPEASAYHRFAMTALGINAVDGFEASDMELRSPGLSYTVDTLARLHQAGLDALQIFFITGADAFAEIATWSRYPDVLDMAHFVVVARPGHTTASISSALPALEERIARAARDGPSATSPSVFLVDADTPDVASTEIRRRMRDGESIRGMVPAPVEIHILKHRLYAGADGPADRLRPPGARTSRGESG